MSLPFKSPGLIEKLFNIIESQQDDGFAAIKEILTQIPKDDLNLQNPDDNMPAIFSICKTSKCSKILELIIGRVDVNVKFETMTPLEFVISNNSEEYLLILLESEKVEINVGDPLPFSRYLKNVMENNLQVSQRIVSKFIERKAIVDSELLYRAMNRSSNSTNSSIPSTETIHEQEDEDAMTDDLDDDARTVNYNHFQKGVDEEVSEYERIILKSFSHILESVKAPQFVQKIEIIQRVLNRAADYQTMEEYSRHNLLQFMSRKLIDNTLSDDLSARYYFSHSLDFDHKISYGNIFYDPGRSKEFKDFAKYSTDTEKTNREVIYVDINNDAGLKEIIEKAKKLKYQNLSQFYRDLSQLVSEEMGGLSDFISVESRDQLEYLTKTSPLVPLGKIKKGMCRHRALLFKVICDQLLCVDTRIKCRLLRGDYNGYHAWNEVEVEKGVKYVIDTMQKPGELITDSDSYLKENSKLSNVVSKREFNSENNFNSFQTKEMLGEGGQAKVFSITFEGKHYAVKNTEKSNNEVYIMSYVNHPNIIKLFNYTSESNQTNMFLEKMDTDLEKYLNGDFKLLGEEQKISEILVILISISLAMEYLHNRNIIHRDLKPANILLKMCETRNIICEVKLADFGISKVVNKTIGVPSQTGTYRYMHKAMFGVKPTNQKVLDIYSFGVVFHDLLFAEMRNVSSVDVDLSLCVEKQNYPLHSKTMEELEKLCKQCCELTDKKVASFTKISLGLIKILRRFNERQEMLRFFPMQQNNK